MTSTRIFLLAIVILCSSCARKSGFNETGDSEMVIQSQQMEEAGTDTAETNYKVRIIPAKKLSLSKNVKQDLWYHMDSCFYLQSAGKKVYPVIIQPVANGVSGSYEYLVGFELNKSLRPLWTLVYADRFINHKNYNLINKIDK